MFSMDQLTNRQMMEVSKVMGDTPDQWEKDPFRLQTALAWQAKKAAGDKDFTFEDALDLTVAETSALLGVKADAEAPLEK